MRNGLKHAYKYSSGLMSKPTSIPELAIKDRGCCDGSLFIYVGVHVYVCGRGCLNTAKSLWWYGTHIYASRKPPSFVHSPLLKDALGNEYDHEQFPESACTECCLLRER